MSARSRPLVVWDDRFRDYDFGPGHPFTETSRGLAVQLLATLDSQFGPGGPDRISELAPAGRADLERFHTPPYLERLARLDASGTRELLDGGDTPSFPGCLTASARIVAGTLMGLAALESGDRRRAFNPGGGLHHAHSDRASGFCILNDLAVALSTALRPGGSFQRVAYVDIDAHHGDGVMYGFYEDGRVLDIDFHQDGRTIFPGTGFARETGRGDGAGTKINLPLPPGTGDEGLTTLFDRVAVPMLREFRPELIVFQSGVDGHAGDSLGSTALAYSPAGYRHIVRTLCSLAEEQGDRPILVTGGGGYSPEHVTRVLAAVGLWLSAEEVPSGTTLSMPWREAYARSVGATAPKDWGALADPEPWLPKIEEHLIDALELSLGRRFPKVARSPD